MTPKFKIDFSYGIDDWLDIFRRFFAILVSFFDDLGYNLFKIEEEEDEDDV